MCSGPREPTRRKRRRSAATAALHRSAVISPKIYSEMWLIGSEVAWRLHVFRMKLIETSARKLWVVDFY